MGIEHGAYLRRSPDIRHMVSFYWRFLQPAVAVQLAGGRGATGEGVGYSGRYNLWD